MVWCRADRQDTDLGNSWCKLGAESVWRSKCVSTWECSTDLQQTSGSEALLLSINMLAIRGTVQSLLISCCRYMLLTLWQDCNCSSSIIAMRGNCDSLVHTATHKIQLCMQEFYTAHFARSFQAPIDSRKDNIHSLVTATTVYSHSKIFESLRCKGKRIFGEGKVIDSIPNYSYRCWRMHLQRQMQKQILLGRQLELVRRHRPERSLHHLQRFSELKSVSKETNCHLLCRARCCKYELLQLIACGDTRGLFSVMLAQRGEAIS